MVIGAETDKLDGDREDHKKGVGGSGKSVHYDLFGKWRMPRLKDFGRSESKRN